MPNGLLNNLIFSYQMLNGSDDTGANPFTTIPGGVTFHSGGPITGTGYADVSGNAQCTSDANSDLEDWSGDFTAELWYYVHAIGTPFMPGVSVGENNADGWDLTNPLNGLGQFNTVGEIPGSDQSYPNVSTGALTPDSTWHQAVFTWQASTKTLSLYIDEGSAIQTVSSVGGGTPDPTNQVFVRPADSTQGNRTGPTRAWKVLLTPTQRGQLWNSGAGLPYSAFDGGGPPPTPHGIVMIGH